MRRLPSLLLNVVLALLTVGAVGWSLLLVRGTTTTTTKTASDTRTVTVAQGKVTATVTADGTLEAATTASATFGTAGTVTAVSAKVGQTVTAGQLLATVDPAAAQRALALANANLEAASDALDRAADAGTDTTAAANAVTTARLTVTDATATVAATRLTAPIAGTVIAVNGTVGSSVSAGSGTGSTGSTGSSGGSQDSGTGFVEIANLAQLQVMADFGEADATKLAAGQAATIDWSALPDASATGKVLAVDPSATSTNSVVTYGVSISVDTLPAGAKPGQTVSVTVTTGTRDNATYVNSAAVTVSGTRYTVTVRKDDGTTEARTVTVGLAGDDAYEIASGLTVGEKVVLPETSTSSSSDDSRQQGPGGGLGTGTGGGPPAGGGGNGGPP